MWCVSLVAVPCPLWLSLDLPLDERGGAIPSLLYSAVLLQCSLPIFYVFGPAALARYLISSPLFDVLHYSPPCYFISCTYACTENIVESSYRITSLMPHLLRSYYMLL